MSNTVPIQVSLPAGDDPAQRPDPLLGTRLNNIELVRRLDQGGMGTIYLGLNRELSKEYAVKVSTCDGDPQLEGRALREAKALSQLDHPNIVQVFDAWTLSDGRLAIVMPLLSGSTLLQHIGHAADGSSRPLPVWEAVHLAVQLAMGLGEAHRHGFVHRDLKPGNVFVTQREVELEGFRGPEVKLLDFGLVRVSETSWQPLNPDDASPDGAPLRTIAGGTPEYVSPEQCSGTPNIDGRADLYSLGVLLFELLAGRLPFVPPHGMALREQVSWLVGQHFRATAPRVTIWAGQVPRPLEALVSQLLLKAPAARPQSAAEVETRLREILRALPRAAAPGPRPTRRRAVGAAAGLGAALTLALVLGLRPPAPEVPEVKPAATPAVKELPPAALAEPPPPVSVASPITPPPAPPLVAPEAAPTPPPARQPGKPPRRRTAKKPGPARHAPAAACTPDERWRDRVLADLRELAQMAKDDAQLFAKFKRVESRLSPLVRSAASAEECSQANRLLEDLKASVVP